MNAYSVQLRENCPVCHCPPTLWVDNARFGSRDIYWIGCEKDDKMAGGNTHHIAVQNWNRLVAAWTFSHSK